LKRPKNSTQILDSDQIHKKVRRMAFEIHENYFDSTELVMIGIKYQGVLLADMIHKELKKIHPIQYHLGSLSINKKEPFDSGIELQLDLSDLEGRSVILFDDVLHSGKTLAYGMKPLLEFKLKRLQVGVLINRDHKSFPVTPDYVGLSLGTTLDEHVEVILDEKGKEFAYLT
jgi:pyrimidine operon attenuation protein / uracil phosphoribosyltransferase